MTNSFATCYEPIVITEEERLNNNTTTETTELNGNKDITDKILPKPSHKYIQVFILTFLTFNKVLFQVKPLPALTEQICVCMVSSLSAYILQSTLESMVTPLTRRLLGWQQNENAIFFIGVGITAVIGYLSVTVFSSYLKMNIKTKVVFSSLVGKPSQD